MVDIVTAAATVSSAADKARTGLAENFELFLGLLTEQLKNQDPLSPLDSNEFVNQLVQFSGVEQAIAQNDNLEKLLALQTASAAGSAVAYIGKEAVVAGQAAVLANDRAAWTYTLDSAAQTSRLVISDEAGKVVVETGGAKTAGPHEFVWDGKDAAGNILPPGVYKLQVAAVDGEEQAVATSVSGHGLVTGVDFSSGEPALLFGDASAPLAQVISVREAPPSP